MAKKKVLTQQQIQCEEIIKKLDVKSLKDLNDLIGQMTKTFLEKSLETEFDEHMEYEKYDQNSRSISNNYRKGKTLKTVKTDKGELTIEIPRDNDSTFQPMLVKKYERNISGVEELVIKLYSKGMSTRNIESIVEQAYHFQISKDLISKITDKIIPEIHAWQNRPLENIYPIVYIDGIRFKIKEESIFCDKSVYIIIGVNLEGYKEALGFWISESESAKQWLNIFNEIKTRGVEKIALVCCDNLKGISESLLAAFPEIKIQKCVIHQIRNSSKHVSPKDLLEFNKDMKEIYKSSSYKNALNAFQKFEEKWIKKYKYAVESWRNNFEELTTFFEYPAEIRKIIYTTNTIENLNRNIRKITKTKGSFTTQTALVKLIYLRLTNIQDDWNKRAVHNWPLVMEQLRLLFPNIFSGIN